MTLLKNPIGRLRAAAIVEGISFAILLFIAMPLKYIWDYPLAVRIAGMTHGVLFLIFCVALLDAWGAVRWPIRRVAVIFVAALLPFGPFFVDPSLRRDQEAQKAIEK